VFFVFPFGFWWQGFADVWPAAKFEAEFCGSETLATGGLLFLRQILRPVAKAASVIAVVVEQSNSTATAAAADEYSTMFAETRSDPFNTKALKVAVTARDFDMASKKTQAGDAGIFQFDIGFIDLAVIARNDVAQFIDID
jgi:hypothetical protein